MAEETSGAVQLVSPGLSPSRQPSTGPSDGQPTPPAISDRRSAQLINADGLYKYSCVVCASRKIKCDRKDPCGNCAKANSQCVYRAPPPPRRRKKGVVTQSTVLERLKRAEDMLANQQAGHGSINNMMWRLSDMRLEKRGQLINHNNSTRYLDNTMWIWLNEELRDIRSVLEDEVDEDDDTVSGDSQRFEDTSNSMLFATSPKNLSLQDQHPSPVHIFQLWQTYLQNVQPLIKILHAPSAQQQIIDAASHLDAISRPLECLMFSIYYLVAVSMSDEECEERFQETRSSMVSRYRQGTQLALLRAEYLTSYSLTVLQAYMIYLVALRTHVVPAAMWALSGVSVRMAHRMGLHRDGEVLGLPVFEVEIRRRLWWEIIFFDSRMAQLSGTGGISLARGVEYKPPRNVNDSELYPGMKSPPTEHEGVTEMIHAMLRAEIGNFLIRFPQESGTFDGSWQGVAHSTVSISEKDKLIDEFELRIERKFVSKCDPLIPTHLLARTIARSAMSTIRFMAHNPRMSARGESRNPDEELLLLDCSYKILENTIFIQTEPSLQRFNFYTRMHFQYIAMVYLLKMMRKYTSGEQAERGWRLIHDLFALDPPVLQHTPRSLYKAIGDLLLSAWAAYETNNTGLATPVYIVEFKMSRGTKSATALAQDLATRIEKIEQHLQPHGESSLAPNHVYYDFSGGLIPQGSQAQQNSNATKISHVSGRSQAESMNWEDWDRLIEVGDLSAIDFSMVSADLFSTGQPEVSPGYASFSNWYANNHP